jgi:hypothetical protein
METFRNEGSGRLPLFFHATLVASSMHAYACGWAGGALDWNHQIWYTACKVANSCRQVARYMSDLLQSDRLQRTDLAKLGACLTHGSPSIVKHTRRDAVERLYVSIICFFKMEQIGGKRKTNGP